MAVFFAKDVLTIVLYISFFAARRDRLVKGVQAAVLDPTPDIYLVRRDPDAQSGIDQHLLWHPGHEGLFSLYPLDVRLATL